MNDLQWNSDAAAGGHGEQLARELGCTPVYLHYNTARDRLLAGIHLGATQ